MPQKTRFGNRSFPFASWYAVSPVRFSRFPFLWLYGHKKDLLVAQTVLRHKHSLPEMILCGYSISALVRARLRVARPGVCLREDARRGNTGDVLSGAEVGGGRGGFVLVEQFSVTCLVPNLM